MRITDLQIPVNPEYAWNLPPEAQGADYANPVELNNKLIEYANAQIRAAAHVVSRQRQRAEVKVALKAAEAELQRFRTDLLRQYPPPATDRKNNLLMEAYVHRMAFETGQLEALREREAACAELETSMERLDTMIESGKQVLFLIKDLVVNIQTHLAYRKHEYQMLR